MLTFNGDYEFDLSNIDEATKFINSLKVEFEKDSTNERFHTVILPPISPIGKTQQSSCYPKFFFGVLKNSITVPLTVPCITLP